MSDSDLVQYVGGSVSVAWRAVAERGIGFVAWGSIVSVVTVIETYYGGVINRIGNLTAWVREAIAAVLAIPENSTAAAVDETLVWIELSGVLGFLVAAVIVTVTVYTLVRGLAIIASIVRGGIA